MTNGPDQDPSETPTLSDFPKSRTEALAKGARQYFTGAPCPHGHTAPRNTANGACVPCGREASLRSYRKNLQVNRERGRAKNRRYADSRVDTPAETHDKTCKGCQEVKPRGHFSKDRYRKDGVCMYCKLCVSKQFSSWKSSSGYAKRLEVSKLTRKTKRINNPKEYWAKQTKNATVARSKKSGLATDLDIDWILNSCVDICPLSGITLNYGNAASYKDSPTLDRKDNTKGYTKDNCWVISMLANRVKSNATVGELVTIAENIRRLLPYAA